MTATRPVSQQHHPYVYEADGQHDFFTQFGISSDAALAHNTDGIHNGNLLEFKLNISDLNSVLFQAVKYLSKLRVRGVDVPAHILLVDLNQRSVYRFAAEDFDSHIHVVYNTSASRDNKGFVRTAEPEVVADYESVAGAQQVKTWLKCVGTHPIRITADCVVAWAERYYAEVPGSNKSAFLSTDAKKPGELKKPRHFAGRIVAYQGDSYAAFAHILDRLNDKLKKIELGAFYTPDPYVEKATELLRKAIARVPEGNDYVIIDRCAGTGNLERFLTADELSHVIVNTVEEFEYLELVREFGDRVRAVIPPTYTSGDPQVGLLRNGDALSEQFVNGEPGAVIRRHVDDPNCTIILFENPPYAEVGGIEAQKAEGRTSFGWKNSWVRAQMASAFNSREGRTVGVKPTNDLANVFIWSAFQYYLRQPTDSYVVFSPAKYFKSQKLLEGKRFMEGYLFNRKHFHAKVGAGVSVIWWANETEPEPEHRPMRGTFPLDVFDIDKDGTLIAGSTNGGAPARANVRTTSVLLSSLYQPLPESLATVTGIVCELNGSETHRKSRVDPVHSSAIIGYLVASAFSFENADLRTQLTRVGNYQGNGFYLTRSNFLSKLPLFAVGRYPAAKRWWERGVVNRCADNGDNFSHDQAFLKACLLYTALSRHNKCRSFTGSDAVNYRNELCLDGDTLASQTLARYTLTDDEKALVAQWRKVLAGAKGTALYDGNSTYGLCQIDVELNTTHKEAKPNSATEVTVYDYPILNGDIGTLKRMLDTYHAEVIAPKLWEFGLLK